MSNARTLGGRAALEKLAVSSAMVRRLVAGRVGPGTAAAPGWAPKLEKMVNRGTQGGQFRGDRTGLLDNLHNAGIGGLPPTSQQSQLNQRFDRAMGPMQNLNGLGNTGIDALTVAKGKGPINEAAWTLNSPLGKPTDVQGSRQPSNPRASVSAALTQRPNIQRKIPGAAPSAVPAPVSKPVPTASMSDVSVAAGPRALRRAQGVA